MNSTLKNTSRLQQLPIIQIPFDFVTNPASHCKYSMHERLLVAPLHSFLSSEISHLLFRAQWQLLAGGTNWNLTMQPLPAKHPTYDLYSFPLQSFMPYMNPYILAFNSQPSSFQHVDNYRPYRQNNSPESLPQDVKANLPSTVSATFSPRNSYETIVFEGPPTPFVVTTFSISYPISPAIVEREFKFPRYDQCIFLWPKSTSPGNLFSLVANLHPFGSRGTIHNK